jgi:ABC-type phosphate transport system substrate-binding protein
MNYWWKSKKMLAVIALLMAPQAYCGDLYIIANQALNIEPAALKAIFTGETQFSGSVKLDPTDNAAAQEVFLSKVMGMAKDKYDAYWVKKSFRDGVTQPPARSSDTEVIEFVKKTPGGVGYVVTTPAGVKVIQQIK